jgi:hypothetical protein
MKKSPYDEKKYGRTNANYQIQTYALHGLCRFAINLELSRLLNCRNFSALSWQPHKRYMNADVGAFAPGPGVLSK